MRNPFVPNEFVASAMATVGKYRLHPITAKDALEDWIILKGNVDAITQQRGGSKAWTDWPRSCTLEENFKDLAWLETCGKTNQLFSYILRSDDGAYAGCMYVYPIELFYAKLARDYDVDFSFWITQAEYDQGMYEATFHALLEWLSKDWPFTASRIYLRNAEIPDSLKGNPKHAA